MDNIQYDPERILNGLPEDVLKELAKKLKRRIRLTKDDIIQEILSPPKGKPEARVKVWQEINRQLRKELETFSEEMSTMFSPADVPIDERFKIGYMFTLSSNPEIRAMGEELYCQAEQNNEFEKEASVTLITAIAVETEAREIIETTEVRESEESIEAKKLNEMIETRDVEETAETKAAEEIAAAKAAEETAADKVAEETVEDKVAEETVETREARKMAETRNTEETAKTIVTLEMAEAREAENMTEAREAEETIEVTSGLKMLSEEQFTEETEELQKRIKTLEHKLRKAIADGLRTKGQLEKLKIEMVALKSQFVREKEETGKYRNRVKELEEERVEKEKEIEVLKQRLEQRKNLSPQKTKEQSPKRELQKVKGELGGEIDLALYQGRKALIFAERDNDIDIRLNALGIIPIWAMEIDWKRPRRRMSTCEVVLYKMNDKKLKKLDEIRDIARYWNIPCNELLNI